MNTNTAWAISDLTRELLAKSELFQDLSEGQLMEIAALVEEYTIQPDELLLQEGEAARYLFLIVEGRGVAQLEMYRGWLSLGLVSPADVAGWSSLVGSQVYPASVKALTEMHVARIDARGLNLLMNLDPAIGYLVVKRLSVVFCLQYQAALEAFKTNG